MREMFYEQCSMIKEVSGFKLQESQPHLDIGVWKFFAPCSLNIEHSQAAIFQLRTLRLKAIIGEQK